MTRNYDSRIATLLSVQPTQVSATIRLLDEGNTIPFIARYRKEQTLNLDEFKIRQIEETVQKFRQVDDRRETIVKTVAEQGKLTDELREKIEAAESITTRLTNPSAAPVPGSPVSVVWSRWRC